MKWFALLLILLATSASAQVFEFQGGDSTIFQASAVQATMYAGTNTTALSFGEFGGHFMVGATEDTIVRGWDLGLGDKQVSLLSGGQGISAPLTGVYATRADTKRKQHFSFFVGFVGNAYYVPYGFSQQPKHFGTGYSFDKSVGHWAFGSIGAMQGNQKTMLESVKWNNRFLQASVTGGLLQNARVFNDDVRFHLRHFGAGVNQETLLLYNQRANVSSEDVFGEFSLLDGHAGLVQGRAGLVNSAGKMAGAGIHLDGGKILIRSDYYESAVSSVLNNSVTERVKKFMLVETESSSQGQKSFDFGGGYASNKFSASLTHNELFYPLLANPWRRTLSINLSFRLRHNSSVSLGTVALPDGGTKFTAYGGTYAYRDVDASGEMHHAIGRFEITGTVVDVKGQPVAGAAIRIDKEIIYSGEDGSFSLRVSKDEPYALAIVPAEFLSGSWTVEEAPTTITPDSPVTLTVRRAP